jgi:uncharacterized tellurite resistance protein B-like protein
MIESIRAFFQRNVEASGREDDEAASRKRLQLAACALLLELAHADDEISEEEREHVERAVVRHFDVTEDEAGELLKLAERERREAVDLFQFARLIAASYDESQRLLLAEVMWGVVHADGRLSPHESSLMHKLSRLLDLRPGFLAEAKRRALGAGR